jgi:hypothetical protein
MMHPSLVELPGLNAFNEAIYSRLSPAAGDPPYLITRTRLTSPAHDGAVEPLLSSLGVTGEAWQREGLVVLRATVMDPFFAEGAPTPDHLHGFLASLRATAEEVHADMPAAPR